VYDQSVGAGFKAAPTNHFTQQFKDGSLNLITAITKNFSCIFVCFVVNNLFCGGGGLLAPHQAACWISQKRTNSLHYDAMHNKMFVYCGMSRNGFNFLVFVMENFAKLQKTYGSLRKSSA
ncbi:MAG: hypothetical protein ACOX8U_11785, partial [Bradymonadia bacterium]